MNLDDIQEDREEQFTFFWNGPFSQWSACIFEVDGIEYNCAEQYMMAEKARKFDDGVARWRRGDIFNTDDDSMASALDIIMEAEHPKTQKWMGRQVTGFDVDEWERIEENGQPFCWNVVYKGNHAKFTQNEHLQRTLFETDGTTLVEASPYDTIWGIGWREDDLAAQDRDKWRGRNWLGEVLTVLRQDLIAS